MCYKCGKPGHKSFECKPEVKRCFRCGREGHIAPDCDRKDVVCFNCEEVGHVSSKCPNPKKEKSKGRVFVLTGSESAEE